MRIAINGFGRIGKLLVRKLCENSEDSNIRLVAINDPNCSTIIAAHSMKYDSIHGKFNGNIVRTNSGINVNEHNIEITNNPFETFQNTNVDLIVECSGKFANDMETLSAMTITQNKEHRFVLVSSPSDVAEYTIVFGMNEHLIHEKASVAKIFSMGSSTSSCMMPILYMIDREYSILAASATSIHANSNDQPIIDSHHSDLRMSRAGGLSIIPTTSGAEKLFSILMPKLAGNIICRVLRVPVSNVSALDIIISVEKPITSVTDFKRFLTSASKEKLANIIDCCDEPLVSVDFVGNTHSAIIDTMECCVVNENMCRILAWYDNEIGYVSRMCDFIKKLSEVLNK